MTKVYHFICQLCGAIASVAMDASAPEPEHPPHLPKCECGGKWKKA